MDVLFAASPECVTRKKLLTIARSEKKYADEPGKTVVSEAFTNLRKICGVNKDALTLNTITGGRLNAFTYPLKAQLPPTNFF